jgi:hypothetical protein
MDPDPVVVVSGIDRVVFQSPAGGEGTVCDYAYMHMSYEIVLGPNPADVLYLWWTSDTSEPQGPFCQGTWSYTVWLRGSHGDIRGSFGPFTIQVVPPQGSSGDEVAGATIGVFADPQANSCVLENSPGPQRAYVCARLGPESPRTPSSAEFRVVGFPSEWPINTVRLPAVQTDVGTVLGDGVRASLGGCSPTPPLVVALYEIDYEVTAPVASAIVSVDASRLSSGAHPTLTFCQNRGFSEMCAVGGRAYLGGAGAPCILAVDSRAWTHVKSLYRDTARR